MTHEEARAAYIAADRAHAAARETSYRADQDASQGEWDRLHGIISTGRIKGRAARLRDCEEGRAKAIVAAAAARAAVTEAATVCKKAYDTLCEVIRRSRLS